MAICLSLTVAASNAQAGDNNGSLKSHFKNPQDVRLGTFWYWMSDNISEEGAVADLKAMKEAGINLAFIGNIGPSNHHKQNYPKGPVPFMSDDWWKIIHTAMKTANDLGMEIGVFNCAGWSQSGGTWVKPEQSMRMLVATETWVDGGANGQKGTSSIFLPKPDDFSHEQLLEVYNNSAKAAIFTTDYLSFFQDVKVVAFPNPDLAAKDTTFVPYTFESLVKKGTANISTKKLHMHQGSVDLSKVIDLSDKLQADGTLDWTVPQGKWVIMRIGMTSTGVNNSPAVEEATGLEVDKMNKQHVQNHFRSYLGEICKRIPAADRKCWKYAVLDSYEKGGQDFTDGMVEKFREKEGYDITPYLPVFFGYSVSKNGANATDAFFSDLRQYISNEITTEYVAGLTEVAHEYGFRTWLENYGHGGFSSETLTYGRYADEVSGEFWSTRHTDEKRDAASCAHIYGKPLVWAESFTSDIRNDGAHKRYPGMLKPFADLAFTQGINSTILHVYIQQYANDDFPGIDGWFGTELNRKNTYWSHMSMFTDYLKRCNLMLQQGRNVADVAYYIGQKAPDMHPDVRPALPDGYQFDYINYERLLNDITFKDGSLCLSSGAKYKVLVLNYKEKMDEALTKKIESLRKQGACIVGDPDTFDGKNCNFTMQEVFDRIGLKADCLSVPYTHRHLDNGTDIYFIANTKDTTFTARPVFRAADSRKATVWNPVNGTVTPFNGEIRFAPYESAFVVFSDEADDAVNPGEPINTIALAKTPWTLTFQSDAIHRGPAEPLQMAKLQDLTKSDNQDVKYYSGTVVYENTFKASSVKNKTYSVSFNKVGQMAKVHINGQYAGGLWTAPYSLDITSLVKKGKNTVRIEVVNTWYNRLVGDWNLPESERKLHPATITWNEKSELMFSGLE